MRVPGRVRSYASSRHAVDDNSPYQGMQSRAINVSLPTSWTQMLLDYAVMRRTQTTFGRLPTVMSHETNAVVDMEQDIGNESFHVLENLVARSLHIHIEMNLQTITGGSYFRAFVQRATCGAPSASHASSDKRPQERQLRMRHPGSHAPLASLQMAKVSHPT
jgi:hypothetical protein